IAGKSPTAIRGAKRLIELSETPASQHDILLAESAEQGAVIGTPNQKESVMANMEKRAPVFAD
ncbi:MAG: enoyl-CoA hydratase, partial [Phenylobacterium sp.]|nr:enoyl-CoA hydratase [Phenylobacterium sp.]